VGKTLNAYTAQAATAETLGEFQDVLDYAARNHGEESATVRLLSGHVAEMEAVLAEAALLADDPAALARAHQERQEKLLGEGLTKSPVVLMGLGIAVATALMGMSTLFISMLAAKWLTFM